MPKTPKPDWRPGEHFETQTERLVLRSLVSDDITQEYVDWWNDPECQQGFGNPGRGWTLEKAKEHVTKFDNETNFHLGIFWKETGKLIGFYAISIDPRNSTSTANLLIGNKSFWKKGVAKEAASHLIPVRFEHMGVEKIETKIKGENPASTALHNTLGFKREGVLRSHCILAGGVRGNIYLFGLMKEEWASHD